LPRVRWENQTQQLCNFAVFTHEHKRFSGENVDNSVFTQAHLKSLSAEDVLSWLEMQGWRCRGRAV